MAERNIIYKILKFVPVMLLGAFIMAFSFGASTAHAETAKEAQAAEAVSADDGTNVALVVMGGMLVIIIAVVLSVVGTVVSSVASVEAGDEA